MRRSIRATAPGATYFFTAVLSNRGTSVLSDHALLLRECLVHVRAAHPFRIDAMVVLPEHVHAIWTLPPDDADFATRWMLLKGAFTKRLGKAGVPLAGRGRKGERDLWQRRYWEHQIRHEEDYARHVDYIHFNPVKHGLVRRAADWPHSSFHRYVREGVLPADWGVSAEIRGEYGE